MITTIFYVVAALLVLVLLTRNSRGRRAGTGGFSFSVPSLMGRGSMPNATIVWAAAGAVLFLAIGLVWDFVLAITFAIFAGVVWMKWKKIDGAGFMMVAGLVSLTFWWLGPAHITSVGQQIGAGISGAEAPSAPPLSDAEQAAAELRTEQEARLAGIAAVEANKAAAESAIVVRRATARTYAADVREICGGRYAALRDCRNVHFGINEKYLIIAQEGLCPRADPGDAGTWDRLAQNQYEFIPHRDHVIVTFYNLAVGESFFGNTCQ